MIVFWRGAGLLIPVLAVVGMFAGMSLGNVLLNGSNLGLILGGVFSGALLFGMHAMMGENASEHTLYFMPAWIWGLILPVVITFVGISTWKSGDKEAEAAPEAAPGEQVATQSTGSTQSSGFADASSSDIDDLLEIDGGAPTSDLAPPEDPRTIGVITGIEKDFPMPSKGSAPDLYMGSCEIGPPLAPLDALLADATLTRQTPGAWKAKDGAMLTLKRQLLKIPVTKERSIALGTIRATPGESTPLMSLWAKDHWEAYPMPYMNGPGSGEFVAWLNLEPYVVDGHMYIVADDIEVDQILVLPSGCRYPPHTFRIEPDNLRVRIANHDQFGATTSNEDIRNVVYGHGWELTADHYSALATHDRRSFPINAGHDLWVEIPADPGKVRRLWWSGGSQPRGDVPEVVLFGDTRSKALTLTSTSSGVYYMDLPAVKDEGPLLARFVVDSSRRLRTNFVALTEP